MSSNPLETQFITRINEILQESGIISYETILDIKDELQFSDFKVILHRLTDSKVIQSRIIISCPHCHNDVGSAENYQEHQEIECNNCGKTFKFLKNYRSLFFLANPMSLTL
jgi:hypothetical protein